MSRKNRAEALEKTPALAVEAEPAPNGRNLATNSPKPTEEGSQPQVRKLSELAREVGLDKGPEHIRLEEQDCKQLSDVLTQLAQIRDALAQHQLEVMARQQAMQQLAVQYQQAWGQRNQVWQQINRVYNLERYKSTYRFAASEKRLVREDS